MGGSWDVVQADIMDWCASYTGEPFHSLLCDPPYSLHFMQKSWDDDIAFRPETWAALAEHLHSGAWVFAFASSRGWHRLACALEDAGLIIQPSIFVQGVGVVEAVPLLLHIHSQSFPKATNISKAWDKRMEAEREVMGPYVRLGDKKPYPSNTSPDAVYGGGIAQQQTKGDVTAPATPLAAAWEGHRYGGQVLRDCACPVIAAQKPWGRDRLGDIVATGAGSLWVEGARVPSGGEPTGATGSWGFTESRGWNQNAVPERAQFEQSTTKGRWPPNLALMHHKLCHPVPVPVPCPACSGDGCPDCGGSGEVLAAGVRKVKGTLDRPTNRTSDKFSGNAYNSGKPGHYRMQRETSGGYADEDGKEAVPRYACARHCECGGKPCETCGGTGTVEVPAVRRVKTGTAVQHNRPPGVPNQVYGQGWEHSGKNEGYADEDGKEAVARYACARCCGTGCGTWWTSEVAEPCPECGGEGEWACAVRRLGDDSGRRDVSGTAKLDKLNRAGRAIFGSCEKGHKSKMPNDAGTAARYYPNPDFSYETSERLALGAVSKYASKASRGERDAGLDEMPLHAAKDRVIGKKHLRCKTCGCEHIDSTGLVCGHNQGEWVDNSDERGRNNKGGAIRNHHPCVKSLSLTKWLAALLLPPDIYAPRRLLVPFCGTLSEGIGGLLAGWEYVLGIDLEAEYCDIGDARARFWQGWSQRTGSSDVKQILKAHRKAQKQETKWEALDAQIQMELGEC